MSGRGTILVVDDDPEVRALVRDLLVDEGYEVEALERAGPVLGRVEEGGVDLLLLDLMLPDADGLRLDPVARALSGRDGQPIALSNSEYSLLLAFVRHPNQVLSREKLLELTHQAYMPAFDRSIDVRIGRLRKKIEPDPREPDLIKTVRHIGYIFATRIELEGEE